MDNLAAPVQAVYPLSAARSRDLEAIARHIGADPRSLRYFQPKRRVRHLYAPRVDYRAAAFVKQELLARGGDAVVARHVIDGRTELSDLLMMGTDGQLAALLQKLRSMDCWGLKSLRTALAEMLENDAVAEWTLPLPGGRTLTLNRTTRIMGILNLTPDSFHAPSRVADETELLRRAEAMLSAGADILDLGAESTRPGSAPTPESEELERLLPRLSAVRRAFPEAVLSVDTYKGNVALAAADAGADIINDVGGFGLDGSMLSCAARTGLPYVLSHIQGTPATMQDSPSYDDLLTELQLYFQKKMHEAELAGMSRDRIILDPGLGFGKRGEDNLLILKELESFRSLGRPLLIGHSRKGFTGTVTRAADAAGRLQGTTAISALLEGQAQILRVHDVERNHQAMLMARAIREVAPWRS
ncbi:dihydropteroate synthase [uncultured Fretibacterium sp.]|uniref:dihydropteroate synthase n=1 Tax=uncultured Fretibacterium sp. TaxID=1678694 RepID=UPI00260774ED|nr:dihydropteroate synthase [uncultured Fretibacterium sp.]